MSFGDKLIKLRKKEGMSQEELGEKLGVTRQTVSKWELGQTTPEMDKLRDISTLFDISVNYLMNDNYGETEENESNKVENGSVVSESDNNTRKVVLIVAAVVIGFILLAYIVWYIVIGRTIGSIFNKSKDIIDGVTNKVSDVLTEDNVNGIIDKLGEEIENQLTDNSLDEKDGNSTLELLKGTQPGMFVKKIIDEIVSNNNKDVKHQIKLELNGVEYVDVDEMVAAKSTLDNMKSYEVMYKYDNDGYIIQAIIK